MINFLIMPDRHVGARVHVGAGVHQATDNGKVRSHSLSFANPHAPGSNSSHNRLRCNLPVEVSGSAAAVANRQRRGSL